MTRCSDCVCDRNSCHVVDNDTSVDRTVGRPKGSFKSACAVSPNSRGIIATMNMCLVERCFIITCWVRQKSRQSAQRRAAGRWVYAILSRPKLVRQKDTDKGRALT